MEGEVRKARASAEPASCCKAEKGGTGGERELVVVVVEEEEGEVINPLSAPATPATLAKVSVTLGMSGVRVSRVNPTPVAPHSSPTYTPTKAVVVAMGDDPAK